MKKLTILVVLGVLSTFIYAQTPNILNYQTIIKNSSGEIIANQSVSFQISILEGNSGGSEVFTETHAATTNDFGLVNLRVGEGTLISGSISEIDWGANNYFLKIELDASGGTNYIEIGNVQLIAVPYALYAKNVENNDDADADATNEIQTLEIVGDQLSISSGNTITIPVDNPIDELQTLEITGNELSISDGNSVFIPTEDSTNELQTLALDYNQLTISEGNTITIPVEDTTNELQTLEIIGNDLTISDGNTITIPDNNVWGANGDTIYYNAGNVGIGKSSPVSKFEVKGDPASGVDDPLFQVINKDGDTVFAVYPDGVQIYISETAKGNIGGFAVSGRSVTKGINEYLRVTPDSVRIYLKENAKGSIGGFAVSGRSVTKGTNDYLYVSTDSTRVYVNDEAKGNIGGFAVSGRSVTKGNPINYFNVSVEDSAQIINPSQPGLLWYPTKEALLSGRVLIEHPDSVGYNSMATGYESKAIGATSQAFGYKCAAKDSNATAMGYEAKAIGKYSFALGDGPVALGISSFAFGEKTIAAGDACLAIGARERDSAGNIGRPTIASGIASMAIGVGAVVDGISNAAIGIHSTAIGEFGSGAFGPFCSSTASNAIAIGFADSVTGIKAMALGSENLVTGRNAVALGSMNMVNGFQSTAIGGLNAIDGLLSTTIGIKNIAQGNGSIVMGNSASDGGFNNCFVYADSALQFGGNFSAEENGQFKVKASGGLYFYPDKDGFEGSQLLPGLQTWQMIMVMKDNKKFMTETAEDYLSKLADIPINSYTDDKHPDYGTHLWIDAEDFYKNFGFGENKNTISYFDVDGVNILAIQALEKRTTELQKENELLKKELEEIKLLLQQLLDNK